MNLKCPHCSSEGSADETLAGSYVLCFDCGKRFIARFSDKLLRVQQQESVKSPVQNQAIEGAESAGGAAAFLDLEQDGQAAEPVAAPAVESVFEEPVAVPAAEETVSAPESQSEVETESLTDSLLNLDPELEETALPQSEAETERAPSEAVETEGISLSDDLFGESVESGESGTQRAESEELALDDLERMEASGDPAQQLAAAVAEEDLDAILASPVEEMEDEAAAEPLPVEEPLLSEEAAQPSLSAAGIAAAGAAGAAAVSALQDNLSAPAAEIPAEEEVPAPAAAEVSEPVVIPDTIPVRCPECTISGHVPNNFYGKKIRCPKCSFKFIAGDDVAPEIAAALTEALSPAKPAVKPAEAAEPAAPAVPVESVPAVEEIGEEEIAGELDDLFADPAETVSEADKKADELAETAQALAGIDDDLDTDNAAEEDLFDLPTRLSGEEMPPTPPMAENLASAGKGKEKKAAAFGSTEDAGIIDDGFLQEEKRKPIKGGALLRRLPSFTVLDICKEALSWGFNISFSWRCWAVAAVVGLCSGIVSSIVQSLLGLVFNVVGSGNAIIAVIIGLLSAFTALALSIPFNSGIKYFSARYLIDGDADISTSLAWLKNSCRKELFKMACMEAALVLLGFMLFIVPGVYLAVAYIFAGILVIDHGLGGWEALELSRKGLNKKMWLKVFGALALITLPVVLLMLLTAGIVSFILSTGGGFVMILVFGVIGIAALAIVLVALPACLALIALLYREIFRPNEEPIDGF